MPLDLTDDKSKLVQVMAWCRQATSHYLSQCWYRSMSPYGITRPQWVNMSTTVSQIICNSTIFFSPQLDKANNKDNTNVLHYWSLLSSMDSPHKGPVMQEVFPCHDVILFLMGQCRELSVAFEKQSEFPPVTHAHKALQFTQNAFQLSYPPCDIIISQSLKW